MIIIDEVEFDTMASEKEMYEIIGRAVADEKFREALIVDPKKAVVTLGYSLTEEQARSLKESEIGKISEELSSRISKMGTVCGIAGVALMGPC